MLRAVVDPGVIISALISPRGAPAELVRRWLDGSVQWIWSNALIDEFSAVCARPRFREWFTEAEAESIARLIRDSGEFAHDETTQASPPPDDGDRYLVDLAITSRADCLVTGDSALRAHHQPGLRIVTPRELIDVLDTLDKH